MSDHVRSENPEIKIALFDDPAGLNVEQFAALARLVEEGGGITNARLAMQSLANAKKADGIRNTQLTIKSQESLKKAA